MLQAIVLILSDDIDAALLKATILRTRGIESQISRYGPQVNNVKLPRRFDLAVIDSHYSSEDALSLVRRIRGECTKPLILLTYESDIRYHLEAYAAGIDECVAKPLGPSLFLAKIAAWLRQDGIPSGTEMLAHPKCDKISHDGLILDPKSRQVSTQEGHAVKLSLLECRLLEMFLANSGRVLETNQLLSNVWHNYEEVDSRLLTNLVYRLRRKLSSEPIQINHIKTIDRIGYVYE